LCTTLSKRRRVREEEGRDENGLSETHGGMDITNNGWEKRRRCDEHCGRQIDDVAVTPAAAEK
jgi:hypothetical protein